MTNVKKFSHEKKRRRRRRERKETAVNEIGEIDGFEMYSL